MCTSRLTLKEQKIFTHEEMQGTEGTCHYIKGHMPVAWITQLESIKPQLEPFHANAFSYHIYIKKL